MTYYVHWLLLINVLVFQSHLSSIVYLDPKQQTIWVITEEIEMTVIHDACTEKGNSGQFYSPFTQVVTYSLDGVWGHNWWVVALSVICCSCFHNIINLMLYKDGYMKNRNLETPFSLCYLLNSTIPQVWACGRFDLYLHSCHDV